MKLQYRLKDYLDATTHTAVGASLRQWTKMLFQNAGQLEWRFIPRILFISIVVILYTPLRIIDRLLYHSKVKQVKVKDPIFILGHYRSGTTFLHYLLCQDQRFKYASTLETINPSTFLGSIGVSRFITNFVLPETRPMDNLKMSPKLPFEEEFAMANICDASLCHGYFFPKDIQKHFDKHVMLDNKESLAEWKKNFYFFCQKLSYRNPEKQLILKTPANTARVAQLLDIFPNAKFIHIYRNPYKVYLSNEGLYEGILPILAFHRAKEKDIETFIMNSYEQTYKRYLKDKKLLRPEQLTELDYESFIKSPIDHLRHIYAQLDLDDFDAVEAAMQSVLDEYKNYRSNQYTMDPQIKKQIANRWSFAFKQFGYDPEANMNTAPMQAVNL